MPDEVEVGTIPNVRMYSVDVEDISRVQGSGGELVVGGFKASAFEVGAAGEVWGCVSW